MTKLRFMLELGKALEGLPSRDVEEKLAFYSEIIDDKIEDGISEEDAVAEIGSVDNIVEEIIADYPLQRLVKEKVKPKRKLKAWEIVLIVLGSPIWLSLGLAAFAVILSLYIVLWALVIVAWSIFVSFAASSIGLTVGGMVIMAVDNPVYGLVFIGCGLVLAGLAIFTFFSCHAATNGAVKLTKKIAIGIKKLFIRRGDAK